jgi:hypothetical protein
VTRAILAAMEIVCHPVLVTMEIIFCDILSCIERLAFKFGTDQFRRKIGVRDAFDAYQYERRNAEFEEYLKQET